jgi:hypothetical protein
VTVDPIFQYAFVCPIVVPDTVKREVDVGDTVISTVPDEEEAVIRIDVSVLSVMNGPPMKSKSVNVQLLAAYLVNLLVLWFG